MHDVDVEFAGGERMWMLASFFIALPGVGLAWLNAKKREEVSEHHHHHPDFVPYAHLRLRTKVIYVTKFNFWFFSVSVELHFSQHSFAYFEISSKMLMLTTVVL